MTKQSKSVLFSIFGGVIFLVVLVWFLISVGAIELSPSKLVGDYPKKILAYNADNETRSSIYFLDNDGSVISKYVLKSGMPNLDYQLTSNKAYYYDSSTKKVNWVSESNKTDSLKDIQIGGSIFDFKTNPDGDKILWSDSSISEDQKVTSSLYVSALDGKNKKKVLSRDFDSLKCIKIISYYNDDSIFYSENTCSSDSSTVSDEVSGNIYRVNLGSGSVLDVFNSERGKLLDIAKNGKYLIYKSNDGNDNDLSIMNIFDKSIKKVKINDGFIVDSALFSINSKNIAVSVSKDNSGNIIPSIYISDLNGKMAKLIDDYSLRSWFSDTEIFASKNKGSGFYRINIINNKTNRFSDYQFVTSVW